MTPFSPIYYIRENKGRSALLCCIFACLLVCYLGGIYITNPIEEDRANVNAQKGLTYIDSQEYRDAGGEGMKKVLDEIKKIDPDGVILESYSGIAFAQMTVLSYEVNCFAHGFKSAEDFERFNSIKHVLDDKMTLRTGEIAITKPIAERIGVKEGDIITRDTPHTVIKDENITQLTVAVIIDADYFESYMVNESDYFSERSVMYAASSEEMADTMSQKFSSLQEQYENIVNISTYEMNMESSEKFYSTYYLIFASIIVLVAGVLAITVNAILGGIYHKRRYEFAVYTAIGFSKREIRKKIAGEILCLNTIGLFAGTVITFLVIFFVNNLALQSQGMHLFYYHPVALLAVVFCDLLVVAPVIMVQAHHMAACSIDKY